jgi:SSS family solute:Na+ symporter
MAANSMSAARRTPLIAAVPKMLFPALVILPGMIAIALQQAGDHVIPLGKDGSPDYNMTIPALLAKYLPTGLLGIGFTALMASFMSGIAGNVRATSNRRNLIVIISGWAVWRRYSASSSASVVLT